MKKSVTLLLAATLTVFATSSLQANVINLYTFEAPPYQVMTAVPASSSLVQGLTVETVSCSAGMSGWSTAFSATPQARAIHSLKRNMIDGYFAIDPSPELDAIAVRTAPVALEKWYFFSLEKGRLPKSSRIAAVNGSNEEAWLKASGYRILLNVSSPSQLIALLERGRIDMALMDERVMNRLRGNTEFHSQFVRYAPLHLYLSQSFDLHNPGFRESFNRFIPGCVKDQFNLNNHETETLHSLARDLVSDLRAATDLPGAITDGPRAESFAEILTIDSKWQALAPREPSPLAQQIADLPASQALSDWQDSYRGLITEVILTNNMGTNVAMSRLTSDYWQGDEPKFQELADAGAGEMYLSPIRYDASTSRFQVIVSTPVYPEGAEIASGVLVIGLDVEHALHRMNGL